MLAWAPAVPAVPAAPSGGFVRATWGNGSAAVVGRPGAGQGAALMLAWAERSWRCWRSRRVRRSDWPRRHRRGRRAQRPGARRQWRNWWTSPERSWRCWRSRRVRRSDWPRRHRRGRRAQRPGAPGAPQKTGWACAPDQVQASDKLKQTPGKRSKCCRTARTNTGRPWGASKDRVGLRPRSGPSFGQAQTNTREALKMLPTTVTQESGTWHAHEVWLAGFEPCWVPRQTNDDDRPGRRLPASDDCDPGVRYLARP